MDPLQTCIDSLERLVSFPSVSSTSNVSVSEWVSGKLEGLGFAVERVDYRDPTGVDKTNLIAVRNPTTGSASGIGLAYFCHTDVVPADHWTGPGGDPFVAVRQDDRIFGRGSCDMKGSLATMLAAAGSIDRDAQTSPLWIVCTADEEVGFEGARLVASRSTTYQSIVEHDPVAIIGEPTQLSVVHAHKGIDGWEVISKGRAAHSSTRLGINANEAIVPVVQTLLDLCHESRDRPELHHDAFDPPDLSWNFGFSDGARAVNITPDRSRAWVSLRPMPGIDGADLVDTLLQRCKELSLETKHYSGSGPMWTDPDATCVVEMCELVGDVLGGSSVVPKTVCYGTDGGVLTQLRQRVVIGPGGIEQAHTTDEWINVQQLDLGIQLYQAAIKRWCCDKNSPL